MGLLALHSAHYSKIFQRLLGTSCSLRWRNDGERELVWTVDPAHPIAAGVPHPIVIDAHEMYGEHFDIPRARRARVHQLVRGRRGVPRRLLLSRAARGRIFYFSPGDQDYPIYHHPDVQRVIANAVEWAAPRSGRPARRARQPRVATRLVRARGRVTAARDAGDLRVGVVGLGWAGQQHIAAYDALPGAQVVAHRRPRGRPSRKELAARYRIEHAVARLGGPAGPRRPRRGQRRRAHLPARSDRDRRAGARHPRAVREADRARRARGRRDGPGRAHGRPRARGRLQPPPARRHPEAQGGRSTTAGSDTPTTRRRGGCAAPASRRSAAGSRGPSSPAAARWSTSACTCSTTRCSSSATPRWSPSAPRPTTCSPTAGFGSSPRLQQDGRDRRQHVRRRGPRLGLHAPGRRGHAARRGQLGRAPPRRRRVRHHALRHRRRRRADRRRLRAQGLPAALRRRRRHRRGHDACP